MFLPSLEHIASKEGQRKDHLFLEIHNKTTAEMVKNLGVYVM